MSSYYQGQRKTRASKQMSATEKRSLEQSIESLARKKEQAHYIISLLRHNKLLPEHPFVLDIGTAQGGFIIRRAQMGCGVVGLEPDETARETAKQLAEYTNVVLDTRPGRAENMPFEDDIFDMVHALSVVEHMQDVETTFAESCRVLKPSGVFWFNSARALHPCQSKIKGFPCFGWYPNWVKLRIMYWARDHRPELVGNTQTPAINWFTLRKARTMLYEAGFSKVHDRWDLDRNGQNYKPFHRFLTKFIRSNFLAKTIAEILLDGISFAAVK